MAINVEFYSFSKRINSTKRPDSGAVTYSCNMINGFSLTHPVLQISGANNQFNPTIHNYARIADFNDRYYFVEDWKYDKGLWSAYLAVDELASWKLTIGATTQFVTRCEHGTYWKHNIYDERFKDLLTHEFVTSESQDYPFTLRADYGCYIVKVVGGGTNISDVVVFDNAEWSEFSAKLKNSYTSEYKEVLQLILMCRWLPFQKHKFEKAESIESIKEVYLDGNRKIPLTFSPTFVSFGDTSDNPRFTFNITKRDHPQLLDYGKCLNGGKYTKCDFVWHPAGVIPIDVDALFSSTGIEAKLNFDLMTGNAIFELRANSKLIYTDTFPFGYEIPLANTTIDTWGIMRGLLSGVASVATGNIAGVAFSGLSIAESAIPRTQIRNGGGGSIESYLVSKPFLQFDFSIIDPCEDITRFGKPSFQKIVLSNLYGYIQCENADFKAAGATRAEITAVNNYMNGGFYYE